MVVAEIFLISPNPYITPGRETERKIKIHRQYNMSIKWNYVRVSPQPPNISMLEQSTNNS